MKTEIPLISRHLRHLRRHVASHQDHQDAGLAPRVPRRILRSLLLGVLALSVGSTCEEPQKITSPNDGFPETDIIQVLARAYTTHDIGLFASLLANDSATNAEYFYVFEPPAEGGETQWGRAEELRLHHRLLRPDSLPPGEDPVPPATWVRSISATFTKLETYQERPDLYSENGGLDGKLLPERWRAKDARYATYFLFHCEDTDYLVGGESNFVVIEDLTKQAGDPGKFLLYLWDDICDLHSKASPSGVTRTCLSRVKALYR